MPRFVRISLFILIAVLLTVGVVAYLTFYSSNSKASFTACIENKICANDNQCGGTSVGKCNITAIDSISVDGKKSRRIGRIGRCICVKPTSKPVETKNIWSYDLTEAKELIECKKSLNVDFPNKENMMRKVRIFNSLKECELDLFSVRTDIAKTKCADRGGTELNPSTEQAGKEGYQFSFNINKEISCWTPILNCSFCNSTCMNLVEGRCPVKYTDEKVVFQAVGGGSEAVRRPLPEKLSCVDVLGRCFADQTTTTTPPTSCPKPAPPPPGCKLVLRKTLVAEACPTYDVVCEEQVPSVPTPSVGTGIINPASKYCTDQGGIWRKVTTDIGEEGWCMVGKRGCEEWAFFNKECTL